VSVSVVERLRAGTVYVAPERTHLRLRAGVVEAVAAAQDELSPRVDMLFESAALYGPLALGVLLTGMGEDGARGLKLMHAAGAWTIGQDRESATVYGMPRRAMEMGAVSEVLSLDAIGSRLAGLVVNETRVP
jgi:two-component system chemotaxis response regulator CheB